MTDVVYEPGKALVDLINHLLKLDKRQQSFIIMLDHLLKIPEPIIVETGCTRSLDSYEGDGMSTVFWDLFCQMNLKADYHSIDINPMHCGVARSLVIHDANIVTSDSVKWLHHYSTRVWNPGRLIDLLYLDSFDLDLADAAPAFLHCFNEFVAIKDKLAPGALICVDDNIPAIDPDGNEVNVSKGQYLRSYLSSIGIEPIHESYQILWKMP